jgi:ABC-type lipoprotein release transport system permease subunit
MNELFGVSMNIIATVCVAITVGILLLVAFIAWRNPVMFKLGLRNIPRRKAQSGLIIVGLMLSTLIMSAAFGTGDTLTTSVTSEVYSILGEGDEWISWDAQNHPAPQEQQVIPLSEVRAWQEKFKDDPDIQAIVPFQREMLPVQDTRTKLNESSARIVGFMAQDAAALGGLKDTSGRQVVLTGNEIALNEDLADQLDAKVGDTVSLFSKDQPVDFTVKAIVPNDLLSGAVDPNSKSGAAVDFAAISAITGRGDNADVVVVSNYGGVKGGLKHSNAATYKLKRAVGDSPYEVQPLKHDLVKFAELIGAAFTTIFVVFGLFSIAAGILLIFLIFVMLAAERKPEMGMARAVGAKRRQLVESFLAEGMGYDLGSALVGLVAGMGVTFAMVGIIKYFAGESLGLPLTVTFTARSLAVAFCLGVIATFLVIFLSSWRASRLNITAAIRDLPESRPFNPEASTWPGYYRAVLNGIVALMLPIGLAFLLLGPIGMLLGLPMIVLGLITPWFYAMRNSNFAAPRAMRIKEAPPRWPWILGLALPVVGWLLILPWYFVALGLVALTRDRKPESLSTWQRILAFVVWPFAFWVALRQDWKAPIVWSAGVASAFGIAGVAMIYGGLDRDSAFFFFLGISVVFLWLAVTLRYFGVPERLSFTAVSAVLLLLWYLPSSVYDHITGPLNGDIEMFFLSGMVMVTAGVFIIVYNADIVLPAIAKLGNRFSRIVPALKTGVAYPLTSRFRTGMTMVMIGLIMFSLVMMATINTNFSALVLNKDSKGGFDVAVNVNDNNHLDSVKAAMEQAGGNASAITAEAEVRVATAEEAQVENRDKFKNVDKDKVVNGQDIAPFSNYQIFGVDSSFFSSANVALKFRAAGYNSDKEVWNALAANPNFAIIPAAVTTDPSGFGQSTSQILRLKPLAEDFTPFTLKLRDPGTGKETTVTVIGQMKESADTFFGLSSADFSSGIVIQKQTLLDTFPASKGQRFYLALKPGTNATEYAKTVESTLVQASADSLQKLLNDQQAAQNGFLLVFQGFMGLGLIVGIAALAVIASRAVVERRQQIGMLRAIGYQRSMIALSFLFESGFIALSGILLGLSLGLSLAWVLFAQGEFGEESRGADFVVPWLNLAIICSIAFVASMFMTFLPARSASRVPVAEALRYE